MKTIRTGTWGIAACLMLAATWTLIGQGQNPGLPITSERLLKADQEPGNWLMYNNTYNGWRYSKLNQITAQNVKNLVMVRSRGGALEYLLVDLAGPTILCNGSPDPTADVSLGSHTGQNRAATTKKPRSDSTQPQPN